MNSTYSDPDRVARSPKIRTGLLPLTWSWLKGLVPMPTEPPSVKVTVLPEPLVKAKLGVCAPCALIRQPESPAASTTLPAVTISCEPKLGLILVPAIAALPLTSSFVIVPLKIFVEVTALAAIVG
ncbi:MAG: hypothetical protein ACREBU_17945, partial [Nitrososphaera sp.]